MQRIAFVLSLLMVAAGGTVPRSPAWAAADTWVSATGTDAGACTIAAPCRTLNYALGQTNTGGTIIILSSGRYAPVSITKSVHIMADGVDAIIEGFGACGATICINAGQNDVVSLHGVMIRVDDPGKHAILFSSGGALEVNHCAIRANTGIGLLYSPAAAAKLHVTDSRFWGGGLSAIIAPTGGIQNVVFDRVDSGVGLHGLKFGSFEAAGSIVATVRDSTISPASGSAILVDTDGGAVPIELMIVRTVITNSFYGIDIRSGQDAYVRMGDSVLSGHGAQAISGSVASYGTNKVVEAIDAAWVPTTIPLK